MSQLDTFDPKPEAPAAVRGPFQVLRTRNPDLQVTELLPRHARLAHKFSVIRTCTHEAPAVHDAGHQVMQTGRFFGRGAEWPHLGCVVEHLLGRGQGLPGHVLLPELLGVTGGDLPHGQNAGFLGRALDPHCLSFARGGGAVLTGAEGWRHELGEPPFKDRERYGRTRLGQSCLRARQWVEAGVRFVTINTATTVFHEPTWDIHGYRPFSDFDRMRQEVAPAYDQAVAALIEDLDQRGLLDSTLVCSVTEFGRCPWINAAGGRDHWPRCASAVLAGGGIAPGRVVGRSDALGAEPVERPVAPAEIVATVCEALGVDAATVVSGPGMEPAPWLAPGILPVWELLG